MNYLDIIIAIILILFAIGGLRNGIIKEAFSLVAFIGGIYGAFKLSTYVGELLAKLINVSPEWMVVISFIVVFIALALLISWLGNLLSDLFASLSLGFVDKLGGLVFGIAKGFLLIGVLILILDFFGIKDVLKEETRKGSKLYKTSEQVATWICDNKEGWINKLNKEFDEIDKTNDNDDVLDII
jgi:membrane protein required for colicin V production